MKGAFAIKQCHLIVIAGAAGMHATEKSTWFWLLYRMVLQTANA